MIDPYQLSGPDWMMRTRFDAQTLGLQLVKLKATIERLVVGHLERLPTDN